MDHIYDVIILGAGPAGLSAGLYAGRSRLDTLIIEKGQAGGQIINTDEIENYPGQIVEGETGVSLVRRMYEQTEQFGAEHVRDTITNAELSGDIKVLTGEKDTYQAKKIPIRRKISSLQPVHMQDRSDAKASRSTRDVESLTVQPVMRTSLLTWKSM